MFSIGITWSYLVEWGTPGWVRPGWWNGYSLAEQLEPLEDNDLPGKIWFLIPWHGWDGWVHWPKQGTLPIKQVLPGRAETRPGLDVSNPISVGRRGSVNPLLGAPSWNSGWQSYHHIPPKNVFPHQQWTFFAVFQGYHCTDNMHWWSWKTCFSVHRNIQVLDHP